MMSLIFSPTAVNSSLRLFTSWILLLFMFLKETRIANSVPIKSLGSQTCEFNQELKDHSISDLFRCTDDLASNSLSRTTLGFSEELDRVIERFQSAEKSLSRSRGRQGPGPYGSPYDGRPGAPFFRPGQPIPDPSGGGFYRPDGFPVYPGLYSPPGDLSSGLGEALNSISQYDDLKCVPRLLCEIATGSNPGNGDYKASTLGDFGKNTLIGLLTAYNFEEASPILAFGKAALLGYTSKGDSSVCYNEYVRCPKDPRDLVYYLNNYNGGFFRFFKNVRGRPGTYAQKTDVAAAQGSNRVGFAIKQPAPPPGLSGPESDRTGTGELKFDNPELTPRQGDEDSVLRSSNDMFSKVVFPGDERSTEDEGGPSKNRASKSLKPSISSGFFPASSNVDSEKTQPPFFPSDDDNLEESNVVFESGEDLTEKDSSSRFRKGRFSVPDRENDYVSVFKFPDDDERESFDSRFLVLFPDRRSDRNISP